ncbi:MAG: hydrogenase formation protein HypD [Planctomycetaceae bacterium]
MKYLDEYRDPVAAARLVEAIKCTARKSWTLMEVCGGQTHNLLRYGIDEELSGSIELIHGPGCPVCVTATDKIDFARQLSLRDDILVTSFGDMLRVPGSCGSLLDAQTSGGHIKTVYSPLDAVQIAKEHPEKEVVFLAVGFETTVPATALAIRQAAMHGLKNFSVIVAHVRVLPAMQRLVQSDDCRVDAFLAAGHVCAITGYAEYESFVAKFCKPVVVTGFELLDLLAGILASVQQLERGEASVENRYTRTVSRPGNVHAKAMIDEVYEVCDQSWRGFGTIGQGGYRIRDRWKAFDALHRFAPTPSLPIVDATVDPGRPETPQCQVADVLSGLIKPTACHAFGSECIPDHPLGAPMVSSEGACAAYYRYHHGKQC